MPDTSRALRFAVEKAHRCKATCADKVTVHEKQRGRTVWYGTVHVFDLFGRADPQEQIGQGEASRILDAFFLRAGVAEIHLLHFPFEDLRQENRRVITFANVAQHLANLDLETPETFNPRLLEHLLRRCVSHALVVDRRPG